MENASKALIIAGAVLISILLISVGIMIMNAASGVTGEAQSQMDTLAIQQSNAKWDAYSGNQNGSSVKNLLSNIVVNNAPDSARKISVTIAKGVGGASAKLTKSTDSSAISTVAASLTPSSKLTVSFTAGKDGYYNAVTIVETQNT